MQREESVPVQSMSDGGLPPNRSQRRVGEAQAMPGAQAHQAEAGRAGGASGAKRKEGAMMPEEVKAKRQAKAVSSKKICVRSLVWERFSIVFECFSIIFGRSIFFKPPPADSIRF